MLAFLCVSHAVAFGAGLLAAKTSAGRERFVASVSVCVGSALFVYPSIPGSLSAFPVLVSMGSCAVCALLDGVLARRNRLRREGRNAPD